MNIKVQVEFNAGESIPHLLVYFQATPVMQLSEDQALYLAVELLSSMMAVKGFRDHERNSKQRT